MIDYEVRGDWSATERFLKRAAAGEHMKILGKFGAQGVAALSSATPRDSGVTAASWDYNVKLGSSTATITWTNSHINNGVNIAVILQYGHGTGTGGYVAGRDYINPAMRPIFERIADEAAKAVSNL